MKIILNTKPKGLGGSSIFLGHLVKYLEEQGHEIYYDLNKKADILLINCWMDLKKIPKGIKIVQRVDGVNHNLSKGNICAPDINNKLSTIHSIADGVIYQSKFAKLMCEKYLIKTKPNAKKTIIYNGTDEKIFSQKTKFDKFGYKHMILTASKWRPHKRLNDVIKGFLHLGRGDTCLVIVGDVRVGEKEKVNHPRIFYSGTLNNKELAKYHSNADVFVFLSWLDWCPNVVAEALVAGTPVICTNQGGTKELVKDSGIILKTDPEYDLEPCYLYEPPEVPAEKMAKAINEILDNKEKFKVEREDLYISEVGKRYGEFFLKVIEK